MNGYGIPRWRIAIGTEVLSCVAGRANSPSLGRSVWRLRPPASGNRLRPYLRVSGTGTLRAGAVVRPATRDSPRTAAPRSDAGRCDRMPGAHQAQLQIHRRAPEHVGPGAVHRGRCQESLVQRGADAKYKLNCDTGVTGGESIEQPLAILLFRGGIDRYAVLDARSCASRVHANRTQAAARAAARHPPGC